MKAQKREVLILKSHSLALARTRTQSIRVIFLRYKEKDRVFMSREILNTHLQMARDITSHPKPLSLVPGQLLWQNEAEDNKFQGGSGLRCSQAASGVSDNQLEGH